MMIARPIGVCSPLPIVKDPNGPGIDASSITSGTIDAARMYVAIDTYANIVSNYPAASFTRSKAFATNLGISGSEVFSNGSRWIPVNGMATIAQLTLPLIKAPTLNANASGTANGSSSLSTAVGAAYTRCFMYFPAGVVHASQTAGWYYTEMSSTTALKVYNNTYTPAAGELPTEPTNKVEFSGAVPGGAGATTELTAFIFSLPGGLLGNYGSLFSMTAIEHNNNANEKKLQVKLDSTALAFLSGTATASNYGEGALRNIGSQSRQRSRGALATVGSGAADLIGAVDTSATVPVSITLQTASAGTDWIAVTRYSAIAEVLQ